LNTKQTVRWTFWNFCWKLWMTRLSLRQDLYIDWYHKSSFSGRCLSNFSSHPSCHKIGTIYNLLDRAILLSHPVFQQKYIEICVKILLENGYPLDIIFREMNARLKKLFRNNRITNHYNNVTLGGPNSDDNKKYLVIPYIRKISEVMASIIDKSKCVVGYKGLNKLSEFIKVQKDKSASTSNSNVVYKVNCNNCDTSYVEQTKRQLKTRLKEYVNNIKLEASRSISDHESYFEFESHLWLEQCKNIGSWTKLQQEISFRNASY